MYAKISISDLCGQHYFEVCSCVIYVSIRSLGKGTRFRDNTYIFFLFYFDLYGLGTWDRAPTPSFHFFFLIIHSSLVYWLGTEGLWDRSPTASFLLFSFSLTFPSWPWGYGIESPQPHFIFLFNSLNKPRGRRFDSHMPQLLFSFNSLSGQEVVGLNPTPLIFIFTDSFSSQGPGSNPPYHIF